MALIPGYKSLGGKSLRVLVEKTGEIISRRQYAKIKNLGQTNEALAKWNREANPEKAISRPARGRTSLQKLETRTTKDIAAARLENAEKKALAESVKREEKKIARRIELASNKKVKVPKVTARLLKAGQKGRRIAFNTYADYVKIYAEAKATGKIVAYGLGMNCVDERTGLPRTPTIYTLRAFDGVIPEDDFQNEMTSYLEAHSYLIFLNFYAHLAFKIEYAIDKGLKYNTKIESRYINKAATEKANKKRKAKRRK